MIVNLVKRKIRGFSYLLTKDLDIKKDPLISTILQMLLTINYFTLGIILILDIEDQINHIALFLIPVFSISISGIIIDRYTNIQNARLRNNIYCLLVVAGLIIFEQFKLIFGIIFMIFSSMNLLLTLFIYLSQTNVLNRGRKSMVALYFVILSFGILVLLLFFLDFQLMYLGIIIVILNSIIGYWEFKNPLDNSILTNNYGRVHSIYHLGVSKEELIGNNNLKDIDLNNLKEIKPETIHKVVNTLLQSFFETGLLFILISGLIIIGVLGFNISTFPIYFNNIWSIVIFILIILSAIFLSALVLDYLGRKPVLLTCALLMAINSVFMDRYSIYLYSDIFFYLFPLFTALAIMGLLSYVGDLTDIFKKGGILGLTLTLLIVGVFLGFKLQEIVGLTTADIEISDAHLISDIISLLLIIVLFLLGLSPETFEKTAIPWRKYLDRLIILTPSGTSIFYYDFLKNKRIDVAPSKENNIESSNSNEPISEDLFSGGITGIQMLLKEISGSNEKLEVLDHSDRKFLFAHGDYCTAILIATKNLRFLRNKIIEFLNIFENENREFFKDFKGNVSKFTGIKDIMKDYFHVKLQNNIE